MQHGEPEVVSAMEKRLHLWCKVLNTADMASRCSLVESILSILTKGNAQGTLEIQGRQQLLKVGGGNLWTVGNNSLGKWWIWKYLILHLICWTTLLASTVTNYNVPLVC